MSWITFFSSRNSGAIKKFSLKGLNANVHLWTGILLFKMWVWSSRSAPSHYLHQSWFNIMIEALWLNFSEILVTGVILYMCPAYERWRYNVTSSFIGWMDTQNDPWIILEKCSIKKIQLKMCSVKCLSFCSRLEVFVTGPTTYIIHTWQQHKH